MLITIDKRGSINLPASLRKEMGLEPGSHLEVNIEDGGFITIYPVEIYRKIRLNEKGISKLEEARESGTENLPDWFEKDLNDAETDLQ
ncbi:MAG: AbrB/MazE/SpoVT family DNA-binding domain-containing protein [Desulfobacteraceae bacterium]|nr:AbrB/MazE/SpoVT family DNA-binding domain-containing protein [Desulfobacteraceae bacterium]